MKNRNKLNELLNEYLSERRNIQQNYKIQHKDFTGAVQTARKMAQKKGYTINQEDWFREINMGSSHGGRSRPRIGKTHTFLIGLQKNGKPVRQTLNITVYGLQNRNFQLTTYIQ